MKTKNVLEPKVKNLEIVKSNRTKSVIKTIVDSWWELEYEEELTCNCLPELNWGERPEQTDVKAFYLDLPHTNGIDIFFTEFAEGCSINIYEQLGQLDYAMELVRIIKDLYSDYPTNVSIFNDSGKRLAEIND